MIKTITITTFLAILLWGCGGSSEDSFVGLWNCTFTIAVPGQTTETGQQQISFTESGNVLEENFNGAEDGGGPCGIVPVQLSGDKATLSTLSFCTGVMLSNLVQVLNGDSFTLTAEYLESPTAPASGTISGTCTKVQ
jgi:hypothetical protein